MNKANAVLNGEWGKTKRPIKKGTNKKRRAAGKRAIKEQI